MSEGVSSGKGVTRRGFLTVAISAIVAGVVAGVGGYYAGTLAAPPEVVKEVTRTVERTTTVTAPPTTVTKTVTTTVTVTTPTTPYKPAPEKIRIGFTLSKTGYGVTGSTLLHERHYFLWLEQVNAKGGMYVPEYGKRIPVEFVWYDDRSDPATVIELYTKLITEDKVDLLLPPWGSHFNLAVAPVISEYKFPLIGTTCYSITILTERNTKFPYFYSLLPQVDALVPAFMQWLDHLKEKYGFRKVGVIYDDLAFGMEIGRYHLEKLRAANYDIVIEKMYPAAATDLTALLTEVKTANPDVLFCWSEPADTALVISQAPKVGLDPPIFHVGIGPQIPEFLKGKEAYCEGLVAVAVWHPAMPYPGAKDYYEEYYRKYNIEPPLIGNALSYAACQILEQAVEKAGSLDLSKIKRVLDTETFPTIAGNIKFTNGINYETVHLITQIQRSKYEIVWPPQYSTAELKVPRPKL